MKLSRLGVFAGIVAFGAVIVAVRRSQPAPIEVVRLKKQDIVTTIAVTGRLEAIDRTSIASTVAAARIEKVWVDVGDRVKRGQPLVTLDTRDLSNAVQAAKADLAMAQASLLQVQAQTEGSKKNAYLSELALKDLTSLVSERDRLKTQVESTLERRRQALAALERTKAGARSETVAAAEAQISSDASFAKLKESELARAKKLFDQGVYSQSQLETAQAARDQAAAKLEASRSQMDALKSGRAEDIKEAEAALKEVEASLAGAKANLRTAETALKNRINERQAASNSKSQLKANMAGEAAGRAQVEAAQAKLEQAQSRLSQAQIAAPFDGVVTARKIEPGQVASAGATLIELSTPGRLRVRLDIDETYLGDVFVGQRATVSAPALNGKQLEGQVTEISSAADPARGTVEVRVSLGQADPRLVSQMTVDVNLIVAERKNVLVVPRQCIPKGLLDPIASILENGAIVERQVKIVRGDETHWIVLEGLSEGDLAVMNKDQAPKNKKLKPKIVEEPKE